MKSLKASIPFYPSPTKETRFFDNHFDRGLEWYHAHFLTSTEDRLVGEVAPTYFASNQARERIAKTIPHAKVVCIFRDPVERVVSLYRLKRAYGMIPWSSRRRSPAIRAPGIEQMRRQSQG
jgi:hypothetical protein